MANTIKAIRTELTRLLGTIDGGANFNMALDTVFTRWHTPNEVGGRLPCVTHELESNKRVDGKTKTSIITRRAVFHIGAYVEKTTTKTADALTDELTIDIEKAIFLEGETAYDNIYTASGGEVIFIAPPDWEAIITNSTEFAGLGIAIGTIEFLYQYPYGEP